MSDQCGQIKSVPSRPLSSMVSIDPESLPFGTRPEFSFRYIDIAAVANGRLRLPDEEIEYRSAPSRARRVVHNGDVLMSTVRPNLKAFAYCDLPSGNYIASTGFAVLRAVEGNDSRYILYTILTDFVAQQIESYAVGSNYPAINSSDVKRLQIPAFPPREQRGIAEILSSLDETIEQTEALIAKYQQIKAGLMHDLFTRGITPEGQLRPTRAGAPYLYKQSPLGWIPKEWDAPTLASLYSEPSRNGLYKPASNYGRGHLMVHMPQMFRSAVVDLSDAARVQVEAAELARFCLQEGDLLFARRSLTLEGAGRCSLVPALQEPTTFESSIIRVRLDREVAVPAFVNCYLGSAIAYRLRLRMIRQVAVSGVTASDVAELPIPCPDPHEQASIIERITTIDNQIEMETAKSCKFSMQKHGLMHDLLTGRVRVKVGEQEEKG